MNTDKRLKTLRFLQWQVRHVILRKNSNIGGELFGLKTIQHPVAGSAFHRRQPKHAIYISVNTTRFEKHFVPNTRKYRNVLRRAHRIISAALQYIHPTLK